ncbi:hypothetical protein Tco_1063888 [Tanacetum coccineum]
MTIVDIQEVVKNNHVEENKKDGTHKQVVNEMQIDEEDGEGDEEANIEDGESRRVRWVVVQKRKKGTVTVQS